MQEDVTAGYVVCVCEFAECGISFFLPLRFAKPGLGRFCSNCCRGLARSAAARAVPRICLQCKKPFTRTPHRRDVCCSPDCASKYRKRPLEERFWEKVDKSGECWVWTGCKHLFGYGKIHVDGKPRDAHRVSYEMHFGAIPDGLTVMHDCPGGDNPACVRPAHLRLGTPGDNVRDWLRKGKSPARVPPVSRPNPVGEAHHSAKLTENDVREIRRLWAEKAASQPEMARRYGVSQSSIGSLLLGETWKHVV